MKLRKGDQVKMSEALKTKLIGKCAEGKHVGPFEDGFAGSCEGCSTAHVEEFGESEGTVQGPIDLNNCKPGEPGYDEAKIGPEVDVRWKPHNLRYAYHPDDLELMDISSRQMGHRTRAKLGPKMPQRR